jgi:hypothetical protein
MARTKRMTAGDLRHCSYVNIVLQHHFFQQANRMVSRVARNQRDRNQAIDFDSYKKEDVILPSSVNTEIDP